MAASLLGSGGVASVPIGAVAATPAVLYDSDGTHGATKDGGACEAYKITNTDSTNWLWIRIPQMHIGTQGTPVMPGETVSFIFQSNFIAAIFAWGTTPGVAGTAVAVVAAGGFQKKV